ncbi:MAG: hypothetical protein K2F97_01555 [Muribaculaceae bacterium]|nr:hypothetical protein [Muribaculaceae bacterium]MDE6486702.1 hypothetical protein [Muribaculaceae bacterium]
MKRTLLVIVIIAAIAACMPSAASAQSIQRKRLVNPDSIPDELVLVGEDTVHMIIPQANYGRFDRGLFNWLYVPKGRWAFGLNASYGELDTEDVQVLSLIKNVDMRGKMYSIKPSISYFVRNNQSVGLQFNYSRGTANLDNLSVDFDEDINFSLHDISYYSESYAIATFYRNYVGLGRKSRFAIFNEVSLEFLAGSSRFKRPYDGKPRDTQTTITQGSLNFSPGLSVFIQENVAFNVSFGIFGIKFRKENQTTDGVDEGSRFTSGANFRFNIFNISLGMMVVI